MKAVVGSVCFICRDGKILLLQRNHPPFQGKWDGLGGLMEFGESPEQAARREAFEESGLRVTTCTYRANLLLYNAEQGTVISSHLFVAEAAEGEVRGSREGVPVWIPIERVQEVDLIDFMQVTLPLVLTPVSFLSGSIVHGPSGEPISYDLLHHEIGGVSRYTKARPSCMKEVG